MHIAVSDYLLMVHVLLPGSSMKPLTQEHTKLPFVLSHVCSHWAVLSAHSSISEEQVICINSIGYIGY